MFFRSTILLLTALLSSTALAQDAERVKHAGNKTNTDVIVDMPPEVWTQGRNRQVPCARCCIYDNRNYSEGAIMKVEGVLLQCARDKKTLGTRNLVWKMVKNDD